MVKFFTKDNCPQCRQAKILMKALKIDFVEFNTDSNKEYRETALTLGETAPIIKYNDTVILGFKVDDIRKLKGDILKND